MAGGFKNIKERLEDIFFEDDEKEEKASEVTVTDEEVAEFEGVINEKGDVIQTARKIIEECQQNFDATTNIGLVQEVYDMLGTDTEKSKLLKVLARLIQCESVEQLKEDGKARKEAIQLAVEEVKASSKVLQKSKVEEENLLKEAKAKAESTYTEAVTQANQECEAAIEEIRKQCEERINVAKEEREQTLSDIASQIKANEEYVLESSELVKATENAAKAEIEKINSWLEVFES